MIKKTFSDDTTVFVTAKKEEIDAEREKHIYILYGTIHQEERKRLTNISHAACVDIVRNSSPMAV